MSQQKMVIGRHSAQGEMVDMNAQEIEIQEKSELAHAKRIEEIKNKPKELTISDRLAAIEDALISGDMSKVNEHIDARELKSAAIDE